MSNDASKPSGGANNKRKGGTKKGGTKANDAKAGTQFSLEREPGVGMKPVPILTGYYGARGERIRHTVHEGALKLPKMALETMDGIVGETTLSAAPKYDLPGLDSVVRPTIDPKVMNLVVTELSLERVTVEEPVAPTMMSLDGTPIPTQPRLVTVLRSKAQNHTYKRPRPIAEQAKPETERIRGGGDANRPNMNPDAPPLNIAPAAGAAPVAAQPVAPAVARPPQTYAPSVQPAGTVAPRPVNAPIVQQPVQTTMPASNPAVVRSAPPAPVAPSPTAPGVGTTPVPQPRTTTPTAPSSSAPAATVSSTTVVSSVKSAVAPAVNVPKIQKLSAKPDPLYEVYRPGPNDEMVTPADQLTAKPSWYNKQTIADIEKAMMPEWFDQSASHRTPESYKKARETILAMSDTVSNRNVTTAMVRRSIPGDAGSLQRLRNFLSNLGLINEDAINDSAPTASILRNKFPVAKQFDQKLRKDLINAVYEQSAKKQKVETMTDDDDISSAVDWDEVALRVGHGASSEDCERNFLSIPISQDMPAATTSSVAVPTRDEQRQDFIRELIESSDPGVVRKATKAAIQATSDADGASKAQSGALLGLVVSRAVEEAQKAEDNLEALLSQIVDQRMKKLENRMVMIEDVESILEAEKVALEVERRDLYTARCRHWFGGG